MAETITVRKSDLQALLKALTHTYLKPGLTEAFNRLVAATSEGDA